MGGAFSSADNNDQLVDNLVANECVHSLRVLLAFRCVDRGHFMPAEEAYRDTAWCHQRLHLSAPCIYAAVLEALALQPGQRFLNLGSGSGYLSTMAGVLLGGGGSVNHGVELHASLVAVARERVAAFMAHSTVVDLLDFCRPQFVVGNALCLQLPACEQCYDRVYCGAGCEPHHVHLLRRLLAVGGVMVVPVSGALMRVQRVTQHEWRSEQKLAVSFSTLVEPSPSTPPETRLPVLEPQPLRRLCRRAVRQCVRQCVLHERPQLAAERLMECTSGGGKKRSRRRRRAGRERGARRTVLRVPAAARGPGGVAMAAHGEQGQQPPPQYQLVFENSDASEQEDGGARGEVGRAAGRVRSRSPAGNVRQSQTDSDPSTSSSTSSMDEDDWTADENDLEIIPAQAEQCSVRTVTVYPSSSSSSSDENDEECNGDDIQATDRCDLTSGGRVLSRLMMHRISCLPLPAHMRHYVNLRREFHDVTNAQSA